jgi:hypothetical protein
VVVVAVIVTLKVIVVLIVVLVVAAAAEEEEEDSMSLEIGNVCFRVDPSSSVFGAQIYFARILWTTRAHGTHDDAILICL